MLTGHAAGDEKFIGGVIGAVAARVRAKQETLQYEICLGYDTPHLPPRDRLIGLLEARGWSQTELARQSDVPRPTINEILSGKRAISKRAALRLARCFRVPAEEFLNDS